MRLLYDAVLPQSLAEDTPQGTELVRWDGGEENDVALVRSAANRGYRGVILFERDSLEQPELREIARSVGVALVAVEADDPIQAKWRILNNLPHLQLALASHDCVLVLARAVHPYSA